MCQADHSKCTVTEKPLYITYTIVYSVFAIYYRKCILWIILIKQKCFKPLIFLIMSFWLSVKVLGLEAQLYGTQKGKNINLK